MVDNAICQLSHWANREKFRRLRCASGEYTLVGFDRLKCIYVHIPKAAGVSVNRALFGNLGGGHNTVQHYKRIFGPYLFEKYFKFAFVRNPYSRLLSAYHFLQEGGFGERDRKWATENLSSYSTFEEFVRYGLNERLAWEKYHFTPQYSFVCDVGRRSAVDFIGKFENIDEDFQHICDVLKIENKLAVHNQGKSSNANWRDHYTTYMQQKVAEIYTDDFELFDYSKDG